MSGLRKLSLFALFVAAAHLIFGGIVRITGSGMGCGDHWPKCYGRWFPPLDRPDLIIEVTHRYLAALLVFTILALVVTAFRMRGEPGVSGRGGVLRAAVTGLALVVSAALFGGVTVKLGNAPYATVGHWLIATLTIAAVATAAIRAGALGGVKALGENASGRTRRASLAAAGIGLIVVMLGGLTAKVPGAAFGCLGFPLCNGELTPAIPAAHIQLTHRVFAILLLLHMLGLTAGVTRRGESPVVRTAVYTTLGLVLLQVAVAITMVSTVLPPMLRSAHQAIGVSIWVSLVIMAYLARVASGASALGDPKVEEGRAAARQQLAGSEAS